MNPECDPACLPDRCTLFCRARRAYAAALTAYRAAERTGDMDALPVAHDHVTTTHQTVAGLHLLPIGSSFTVKETPRDPLR